MDYGFSFFSNYLVKELIVRVSVNTCLLQYKWQLVLSSSMLPRSVLLTHSKANSLKIWNFLSPHNCLTWENPPSPLNLPKLPDLALCPKNPRVLDREEGARARLKQNAIQEVPRPEPRGIQDDFWAAPGPVPRMIRGLTVIT